MSDTPFKALAEAFDRIVHLPAPDRAAALAALPEALREGVRRLLLADTQPDDPVQSVLEDLGDALQRQRAPGARLGAWRILRELGAGGMGTVLLAERAEGPFEQRAAIKLIRGFPSEDSRRRLRQERSILAQLDHPYIARMLDGGETADGQPWVAMEYVEGVALMPYVRTQAPALPARLQLFDRIAQAVAHAHQRLVIHRDLKPGNVLVRADGEPKLLDFGVAKLIDIGEDSARRDTSTRVWTEGYASPEQRQGRPVTTASDVFSLGVMLSELLQGSPAIPEHEDFPALVVDAELRGVIAMACAVDPTRRYPTVEALRDDLERYRDGRPLRAAADTRLYRFHKFLQRHRLPVVAASLAVLALISTLIWLQHERTQANAARAQAEQANQTRSLQFRFLSSVLQGATGKREDGSPMLATDLLDRMRDRLSDEAAGDARARVELEYLLASAYLNAGHWADAKPLFIAAAEHGEGLKDVADNAHSLREAARMAVQMEALEDAVALLDRAEALLGPPPYALAAATVSIRIDLTRISVMKLRRDPQLDAQVEITARNARAWLPESHTLRALVLAEHAARTEDRGDYVALVAQRREVLAVFLADPMAYPSDLAVQHLNLARALELVGELDAAELELDRSDEVHARIHGELAHSGRMLTLYQRASLWLARCKPDEAHKVMQQAQSMAASLSLQPWAADLFLAGRVERALGRSENAETRFQQALAMRISDSMRARIEAARVAAPMDCAQPPSAIRQR